MKRCFELVVLKFICQEFCSWMGDCPIFWTSEGKVFRFILANWQKNHMHVLNVKCWLLTLGAFYLYWLCSLDTAGHPVQYPNCAEAQLQVSNFSAVFLFCFVCLAKIDQNLPSWTLQAVRLGRSQGAAASSCLTAACSACIQSSAAVCAACAEGGLKGWARLWTATAESETFSCAASCRAGCVHQTSRRDVGEAASYTGWWQISMSQSL